MMTRSPSIQWILTCLLLIGVCSTTIAQDTASDDSPKKAEQKDDQKPAGDEAAATTSATPSTSSTAKPSTSSSATPAHVALLKDAKKIEGLIPLYQQGNKVYAELSSTHYSGEYIVLLSIARGIGQRPLLGGMSWGFGDDWVWTFRKVDDRVLIVRKNVKFKAKKGSPEASAVKFAYTDSVLFSLSGKDKGPKGGDLVDLTSVFMSDLPQISQVLPGFSFSSTKSSWAAIKGFKDNIEIQVAATYASSGRVDIESVADSRGVTINVHYSISKIPSTGYQPRLADDRVGYFLTALKDYSKKTDRDRFVRYINRWDLQKADASATPSPPKKPIIFWLEKTIPFEYRKPIREGILEWNKGYEKAGFVNAIEVRQQPEDATWDPEDINYNTFRWITSSAGFAMGPSRVNPYTGQILDADIIFDADFLQFWKEELHVHTPGDVAAMTGGPLVRDSLEAGGSPHARLPLHNSRHCDLCQKTARQFALAATAIAATAAEAEGDGENGAKEAAEKAAKMREELIMQGLKEVAMHEVGHTLGLRHNFKASTFLTLDELNDPEKTRETGMIASVMDYAPVNIVPKNMKQGAYYTSTIGPYDMWAIQYGYQPFSGGTTGEVAELKKIAARSGEPGLAYATDEDTRSVDPDPDVNRFDLGKDAIAYARMRAQLVRELMPGLVDRMTKDGDDYVQARRAFNTLLATHGEVMMFASRYVGGLHVSRSHKGDNDAKPPITVVDPAKQREALALLEEQVFGDAPYLVPSEVYSHLGPNRWSHWGTDLSTRPDYPIHQIISMWQQRVLAQLLSSNTLERIIDTELKVPADQDAFTAAELIQRLTKAIFSEIDTIKEGEFTNRKPAISSPRRNLQRAYLSRVASMAMGQSSAPADCQTIAYAELASLEARIGQLLKSNVKLDDYSRAHLQETATRIRKTLDANLSLSSP